MSPITFDTEISSPVSAKRIFAALILDADNLLPKLLPQGIKSIETLEGNGGPGTIKKMVYIDDGGKEKYVKQRIDSLDKENMTYHYTIIEGTNLEGKTESVGIEIKIHETSEGGSKGTNVTKYYPKEGVNIDEQEIEASRDKEWALYKVVEGFLIANPEAYA